MIPPTTNRNRKKTTAKPIAVCASFLVAIVLLNSIFSEHKFLSNYSFARSSSSFMDTRSQRIEYEPNTLFACPNTKDTRNRIHPVNGGGPRAILVTGGIGFIGMHTCMELYKRYNGTFKIVAMDNLDPSSYNPQLKHDRWKVLQSNTNHQTIEFVKGDVCNEGYLTSIIQNYSVSRIIHLAAQTTTTTNNPHSYIKNNIDCTASIFEVYKKQKLHLYGPLIYASSSSVYGYNSQTKTGPFQEEFSEVNQPVSWDAATKRSTELMAHTYKHLHNISSIGLRFFTVYGPWGRPDMSPMTFANKIFTNETIQLTNFGNSVRDFTYVDDIVTGVLNALEYNLTDSAAEIFNLGGNPPVEETYLISLLETYANGSGILTKNVEFVPSRMPNEGNTQQSATSMEKAKCYLHGWEPQISIEEGIGKFISWYQKHNASKYMPQKKQLVCVINSSYSSDVAKLDKLMDVTNYTRDNDDGRFKFFFFTNFGDELDVSELGWEKIVTNFTYKRFITHSRWPKFLGWKHPIIQKNKCDMIFYFDTGTRPKKASFDKVYEMALEVKETPQGIAFAKHPRKNRYISGEFGAILRFKKDIKSNVNASLTWLREQEDFDDTVQVYQNTAFFYDPSNQRFREASEFFWSRYSLELDSWRDQPLWAYTMAHFNLTSGIKLHPFLFYGGGDSLGFAGHTYTEEDNYAAVAANTTSP